MHTKLPERIAWARQNLEPFHTEYCVVFDNINLPHASVMYPDPHCMAALMHGGIHPPAWVRLQLKKDEERKDFIKHSDFNGHLLHEVEPMGPLTEEQAIEHLITTDIPEKIWSEWNKGNKPNIVICKRLQIPTDRSFRNAWRIADDIGEAA